MSVSAYIEQLRRRDFTLAVIFLYNQRLCDAQVAELIDCLLAHPNIVRQVWLGCNRLTDESGVKLARFVASSSTINLLDLPRNQLTETTFMAMAEALRINTSLATLYLYGIQVSNRALIDSAFVHALRLNPIRHLRSSWLIFEHRQYDLDFKRLKSEADRLGHPTLQELLCGRHLADIRQVTSRRRDRAE